MRKRFYDQKEGWMRKHFMPAWAFLVAVTAMPSAHAAGAIPGGGEILRQIQPVKPAAPSGNQTGVAIPKQARKAIPAGLAFPVKHIRITGNSLFDTAALHALVADGEGKKLNLKQLNALADRITAYYRKRGYSLTRAVLPAQRTDKGVVEIRVLEARYGKITLKNTSRVRSGLLEATLSPLQGGGLIEDRGLNRSMLLLSDIPGISASATLRAGEKVGTSDMDVDVRDLPLLSGRISANNFGNRFTGRARGVVSLQLNNPLRLGDALRFDGVTTGRGVKFGRLGYDVVLNGYGTRAGIDYSLLHYILGDTLRSLNGYGTARVGSGWLSHPLHRGRAWNVYARLQYDNKRLRDHIDASRIRTDRNIQDGVAGLSGDFRDGFITGAVTTWHVQWTGGRVRFQDALAAAADAVTARTAGRFSKWLGGISRLQGLGGSSSLWMHVSGQWSVNNLDSVEKLVVGGPDGVRAYDVGALSADSGYLAQVELRHRFTPYLQVFALFDNQRVRINNRPWTTGENFATLSGAGGGVRLDLARRWHAEVAVARPVGPRPRLIAGSRKTRVWGRFDMEF